jgi:hypothetical protein
MLGPPLSCGGIHVSERQGVDTDVKKLTRIYLLSVGSIGVLSGKLQAHDFVTVPTRRYAFHAIR